MERKTTISQYRDKLDNTLASPELTNQDTLQTLVKTQLLHSSQHEIGGCSDHLVQNTTLQLSNFLHMLRTASVTDAQASNTTEAAHGEWKLKQDTEEFRVMYREGPKGTPFHSLLVEGYIEAPIDTCLCVSWETALYRKWWPHYNFPPFKIITCNCLKKVRIGEQISLVRVKVTWPLSAREAVVHYTLFEYFQDGLIVCLFNTISDLKSIDRSTHGFTSDGIPEAKDVVRIDLVGGFALQKVTKERSYFRTIANMDMKLDLVPPSLINFISRQLIGNGFKLYQKAVVSVSNSDEDYSKVLEDPLYNRIRKALYSSNESIEASKEKELQKDVCILPEENFIPNMQDDLHDMEQKFHNIDHVVHDCESLPNGAQVTEQKAVGVTEEEENEKIRHLEQVKVKVVCEIEEEEGEEITHLEEGGKGKDQRLIAKVPEKCHVKGKRNAIVSPAVEQALETLEKAIYMVREYGFNDQTRTTRSSSDATIEVALNVEKGAKKDSSSSEYGVCSNVEVCDEISKKEIVEKTGQSRNSAGSRDIRHAGSYSYSTEINHNRMAATSPEQGHLIPGETNQVALSVNHNRIAPASPDQDLPGSGESNLVALSSSQNGITDLPILDQTMHDSKQTSSKENGIHENALNEGKKPSHKKKQRYCCFSFNPA